MEAEGSGGTSEGRGGSDFGSVNGAAVTGIQKA